MRWDTLDWDVLDWTWALAVGRRERLLPLWCVTLQQLGRLSTIPADVRHALQHAYYATLAVNTFALEEAAHLSALLETQGVSVVVLKGAALLATVYPTRGARPLGDIDLWVRERDAPQAEALLRASGYASLLHQTVRGPQRFLTERTFLRQTPPRLQVDLHTAPFARPAMHSPILAAWLWAHTLMAPTAYGPLRVFDAAAQFVHLCLHAIQHDVGRRAPLRLHDLALVMADARLDWRAVGAIAQAARITPALQQAVQATTAAWGVAPPSDLTWPHTFWRDRLRCALLASERRAIRWLVDGWDLQDPVSMLALWFAVLWPAPAYRAWRAAVRSRGNIRSTKRGGGF